MVRRIAWLLAVAGAVDLRRDHGSRSCRHDSHIRVPAIAALVTFAAIILSYLGGIECGLALRRGIGHERTRAIALGLSAVPALAALGRAVARLRRSWQIGAALGALRRRCGRRTSWLARHGLIPSWFVDLRTAVTALACAILGVALYLL